jgi:hypothetical protein
MHVLEFTLTPQPDLPRITVSQRLLPQKTRSEFEYITRHLNINHHCSKTSYCRSSSIFPSPALRTQTSPNFPSLRPPDNTYSPGGTTLPSSTVLYSLKTFNPSSTRAHRPYTQLIVSPAQTYPSHGDASTDPDTISLHAAFVSMFLPTLLSSVNETLLSSNRSSFTANTRTLPNLTNPLCIFVHNLIELPTQPCSQRHSYFNSALDLQHRYSDQPSASRADMICSPNVRPAEPGT